MDVWGVGRTLGVAKGVFGYKFVAANHRNVRCLMLLNCFHTRTMLEIESRRVFCFDVGDN